MTNTGLERVYIVEDDPAARQGYVFTVEDTELSAVPVEGPLGSLEEFVQSASAAGAGALCDFELSVRNFATFNGAELVARWYRAGVPAVLCTRFEKAQLDRIRPYRAWIPRLTTPAEMNPDSLVADLDLVMREIAGDFLPSRVAHRTLIRVVEVDPDDVRSFLFEMPGWSTNTILRSRFADLPTEVRSKVTPGFRTHVRANLGAEKFEDLYFVDWESA